MGSYWGRVHFLHPLEGLGCRAHNTSPFFSHLLDSYTVQNSASNFLQAPHRIAEIMASAMGPPGGGRSLASAVRLRVQGESLGDLGCIRFDCSAARVYSKFLV